jgi:hypothetical protein
MAHFIISFRIKSDATYQDRYASFTSRVYEIGGGSPSVWEETSSFFAIRADGTAASVCSDLYLKTDFDSTKDLMVVIDLDKREKATKGEIKYLSTLAACLGF